MSARRALQAAAEGGPRTAAITGTGRRPGRTARWPSERPSSRWWSARRAPHPLPPSRRRPGGPPGDRPSPESMTCARRGFPGGAAAVPASAVNSAMSSALSSGLSRTSARRRDRAHHAVGHPPTPPPYGVRVTSRSGASPSERKPRYRSRLGAAMPGSPPASGCWWRSPRPSSCSSPPSRAFARGHRHVPEASTPPQVDVYRSPRGAPSRWSGSPRTFARAAARHPPPARRRRPAREWSVTALGSGRRHAVAIDQESPDRTPDD
jgi:hypothetical protein